MLTIATDHESITFIKDCPVTGDRYRICIGMWDFCCTDWRTSLDYESKCIVTTGHTTAERLVLFQ